jgi:glycosyltransferase involved in cell wall biosynthesis
MISISGLSAHKNLQIIKQVIPILVKKYKLDARFILTIPDSLYQAGFQGMDDHILNVGPVSIESCPSLYEQADFVFLPTLLECFSALYLEGMYLEKPVLTSDLSFSHAICQDAALYFDPLSAEDIAEKIFTISTDDPLRKRIIEAGKKHIHDFPASEGRTEKYLDIIRQIIIKSNPENTGNPK